MSRFQGDNLPPVFYCRWNWCLSSFSRTSVLRQHVVFDHIRKTEPIRRGDLPAFERAEEGLGESLSIPGHLHGSSTRKASPHSPQELPSSLPTPPGSDPSSPLYDFQPSPNIKRKLDLPQDTGVDPTLLSAPVHTPLRQFHRNHGGRRFATPSFASLSSPGDSPFQPENPPSPEFNAIVEEALRSHKRQRAGASRGVDVSDNEMLLSDLIRSDKLDESANMDVSVNEQSTPSDRQPSQVLDPLTQTTQSETYNQEDHYASMSSELSMPPPAQPPRQIYTQTQTEDKPSPSGSSSFVCMTSSSGSARQAWYGPVQPPVVKDELDLTSPHAHDRSQPPEPSSSPRKTKTKRKHGFRSGSLRSNLPSVPPLKRRSSLHLAADGGLIHRHAAHDQQNAVCLRTGEDQEGREAESQDDSDSLLPPLQTQAAYQSQDLSF